MAKQWKKEELAQTKEEEQGQLQAQNKTSKIIHPQGRELLIRLHCLPG